MKREEQISGSRVEVCVRDIAVITFTSREERGVPDGAEKMSEARTEAHGIRSKTKVGRTRKNILLELFFAQLCLSDSGTSANNSDVQIIAIDPHLGLLHLIVGVIAVGLKRLAIVIWESMRAHWRMLEKALGVLSALGLRKIIVEGIRPTYGNQS